MGGASYRSVDQTDFWRYNLKYLRSDKNNGKDGWHFYYSRGKESYNIFVGEQTLCLTLRDQEPEKKGSKKLVVTFELMD